MFTRTCHQTGPLPDPVSASRGPQHLQLRARSHTAPRRRITATTGSRRPCSRCGRASREQQSTRRGRGGGCSRHPARQYAGRRGRGGCRPAWRGAEGHRPLGGGRQCDRGRCFWGHGGGGPRAGAEGAGGGGGGRDGERDAAGERGRRGDGGRGSFWGSRGRGTVWSWAWYFRRSPSN